MTYERTCFCGNKFMAKRKDKIYCSRKYGHNARNIRVSLASKEIRDKLICSNCGKSLKAKTLCKKYCDNICEYNFNKKKLEFKKRSREYEKKRSKDPKRIEQKRRNGRKYYANNKKKWKKWELKAELRKKRLRALEEREEILKSINENNIVEILKLNNLLEKVCKKAKIPVYYIETYGCNYWQFEKLKQYI